MGVNNLLKPTAGTLGGCCILVRVVKSAACPCAAVSGCSKVVVAGGEGERPHRRGRGGGVAAGVHGLGRGRKTVRGRNGDALFAWTKRTTRRRERREMVGRWSIRDLGAVSRWNLGHVSLRKKENTFAGPRKKRERVAPACSLLWWSASKTVETRFALEKAVSPSH